MLRKRKRRRRPKFWKTPRRRVSLTPSAPSKTGPNHPPARPTPPNLQDLTDQPNGWKQAAAAAAPGAKGDKAPPVPPQAESTSARPKSALKPAQGRHTKSDGGRNVSFDEPTPEEKAKHAQERVDAARAAAAARAAIGEGGAKGNALLALVLIGVTQPLPVKMTIFCLILDSFSIFLSQFDSQRQRPSPPCSHWSHTTSPLENDYILLNS